MTVGASAKDLQQLLHGEIKGDAEQSAWWSLGLMAVAVLATAGLLVGLGVVTKRAIEARSDRLVAARREEASEDARALQVLL